MVKPNRVIAVAWISLLIFAACRSEQRPATTTTTSATDTARDNDRAVMRLTAARCQRAVDCDDIGAGGGSPIGTPAPASSGVTRVQTCARRSARAASTSRPSRRALRRSRASAAATCSTPSAAKWPAVTGASASTDPRPRAPRKRLLAVLYVHGGRGTRTRSGSLHAGAGADHVERVMLQGSRRSHAVRRGISEECVSCRGHVRDPDGVVRSRGRAGHDVRQGALKALAPLGRRSDCGKAFRARCLLRRRGATAKG